MANEHHLSHYYGDKARQALLLADECLDEGLRSRVEQIAYEFLREAIIYGGHPADYPALWHRKHLN
jgi:hypothetical protein